MIRSSTRFVAAILVPATFFCTLEGCKPKKSQSGALTQQTLPSNRMGTLTWTLTLKPRVDSKDEEDLQCWYFYENRLSWFVEQSTAANKFQFLKDVVEDTVGPDGVVRTDVEFPIRFVNARPLPVWAIEKAVTDSGQALAEVFVAYHGTQAAKDALDQKSLIGAALVKEEISLLDAAVQEQYDALYFRNAQPAQVDAMGPLPANQIARYDCPSPTNLVQAIETSLAQNPENTRVRIIESNAVMANGNPIEDSALGSQASIQLDGMNLAAGAAGAAVKNFLPWLWQAGKNVFARNLDDATGATMKTPWWKSVLRKVGLNKDKIDDVVAVVKPTVNPVTGTKPNIGTAPNPRVPPSNVSTSGAPAQQKANVVQVEPPAVVKQEAGLTQAVVAPRAANPRASISKVPIEKMEGYIASVERRPGYQSLLKDDPVLLKRFEDLKRQANVVKTTNPQIRAMGQNGYARQNEEQLQRLYQEFAEGVSTRAIRVGKPQGNGAVKAATDKLLASQPPRTNAAGNASNLPNPVQIQASPKGQEIHNQAPKGILGKLRARVDSIRERFRRNKPTDPKKPMYEGSKTAKSRDEPSLNLDDAPSNTSAPAPNADPKAKPGLLGRAFGLGKKAVVTTAWIVAPNAIMTLMSGGFNPGNQVVDAPVSAELTTQDTTPWTAAESQLDELTNPSAPALDVLESVMQATAAAEGTTMEQLLASGGTGVGGQRAKVAERLDREHGVCWPIARCLVNHLTLQDATTCFEYQCNDPTQNPTAAMAPAE